MSKLDWDVPTNNKAWNGFSMKSNIGDYMAGPGRDYATTAAQVERVALIMSDNTLLKYIPPLQRYTRAQNIAIELAPVLHLIKPSDYQTAAEIYGGFRGTNVGNGDTSSLSRFRTVLSQRFPYIPSPTQYSPQPVIVTPSEPITVDHTSLPPSSSAAASSSSSASTFPPMAPFTLRFD